MLVLPKYDRYNPIVKAYDIDNYTKTNQKLFLKIKKLELEKPMVEKTLSYVPRKEKKTIKKLNELNK